MRAVQGEPIKFKGKIKWSLTYAAIDEEACPEKPNTVMSRKVQKAYGLLEPSKIFCGPVKTFNIPRLRSLPDNFEHSLLEAMEKAFGDPHVKLPKSINAIQGSRWNIHIDNDGIVQKACQFLEEYGLDEDCSTGLASIIPHVKKVSME